MRKTFKQTFYTERERQSDVNGKEAHEKVLNYLRKDAH